MLQVLTCEYIQVFLIFAENAVGESGSILISYFNYFSVETNADVNFKRSISISDVYRNFRCFTDIDI